MEIISVIGMVLGVAVLIYLTFKGVNGFVASLVGSVIVIVSSGLPFWGTLTGTYAASLGSTFGSYLFLFTIGSAYSELMKKSGAAESIANFLFAFLGVKATVAGTLIITFLLAYGGVNAFIIIFAVYPVAVPMFRKANVSKLLMPAIFLYGAVVLNVVTPGAPSMLCIALSEKLGVTTFAAPTMAIVLLVVAFGFGIFYFTWASNSLRARGIGFVASESDAELIAGSTSGKELPPIHLAILPYIVIIVLKLVLANSMSASDGINTAMGVGAIVLIITNYKYLKGHIVQDLVTGFTSSINPLLLTAALCVGSIIIMSRNTDYLLQSLDQMQESFDQGDMEACKQEARQFAKDFEEKTKMFPFFLRHADISRIEEIAIPLPVLIEQGDTQHFAAELVRCRSQLSKLSEMELPLAGNIL